MMSTKTPVYGHGCREMGNGFGLLYPNPGQANTATYQKVYIGFGEGPVAPFGVHVLPPLWDSSASLGNRISCQCDIIAALNQSVLASGLENLPERKRTFCTCTRCAFRKSCFTLSSVSHLGSRALIINCIL